MSKIVKKYKFLLIFLLIIVLLLFKNEVFYLLFSYKKVQNFSEQTISIREKQQFISDLDLEIMINETLNYTNKLSFAYNNDYYKKKANCSGYAFTFQNYFNSLAKERNSIYRAFHVRGVIYFLSFNINRLFKDPFFKTHYYIEIKNMKTNETIFIDPSLYDYTGIKFIKSCK